MRCKKTASSDMLPTKARGPAQQQLLRILSHHMIQLGERAGLIPEETNKDHIIEAAYRQWDAKASFQWSETSIARSEEPESWGDLVLRETPHLSELGSNHSLEETGICEDTTPNVPVESNTAFSHTFPSSGPSHAGQLAPLAPVNPEASSWVSNIPSGSEPKKYSTAIAGTEDPSFQNEELAAESSWSPTTTKDDVPAFSRRDSTPDRIDRIRARVSELSSSEATKPSAESSIPHSPPEEQTTNLRKSQQLQHSSSEETYVSPDRKVRYSCVYCHSGPHWYCFKGPGGCPVCRFCYQKKCKPAKNLLV